MDKTKKYTTTPETLSFVEALEAVLIAEEKCLSAYYKTYGDGGEIGQGEYMWSRTGMEERFSAVKDELRDQISLSVEWEIRDRLDLNLRQDKEETDSDKTEEESKTEEGK